MINKDFFAALADLEREKGISEETFIEALSTALASAYKKQYIGEGGDVEVRLNPEKGTIRFFLKRTVSDAEELADNEISLEDAQEIKKSAKPGDVLTEEFTPKDFTRIAAQTAKQVILQKIHETERDNTLSEFSDKEGELMSGLVRKVDARNVYIELGKGQIEGLMLPQDQVPGERYPVGEWVEGWRDFVRRNVPVGRLTASLFTGERAERLAGDTDFAMSLYKCAASLPGTPSGERLWDIFTMDELYGLWRANNMVFYYEKGPSGIDGGFLDGAAAPLLKDFVDDAAERVAEGKPAVTLRFGHDGVIMGLLNCMKVRGWCEKAASMEEIEVLWHDFDIPMASNLQWVFYRNAAGDVLVKMLLNEQEIEFPLESDTKPYYRWSDVEALYRGILAESYYDFGRGCGTGAK